MNETAIRMVLAQLDDLACANALEANLLDGDPRAELSDRDKYIAHDSSALSFEAAARLLRKALS